MREHDAIRINVVIQAMMITDIRGIVKSIMLAPSDSLVIIFDGDSIISISLMFAIGENNDIAIMEKNV